MKIYAMLITAKPIVHSLYIMGRVCMNNAPINKYLHQFDLWY